jgi:addiction module RelE/StbE family toxin
MIVRFSKRFLKQLAKQPEKVQEAFYIRLELFQQDMYDVILHNHPLQGKLKGLYSINVTGDVRAVYEIVDGQLYMYQMIGTHAQLY